MPQSTLRRLLRPSHHARLASDRWRRSVQRRGLLKTAALAFDRGGRALSGPRLTAACRHLRRRLGAVTGRLTVGPRVIRLTPLGFLCNHRCVMCWHRGLSPADLQHRRRQDLERCLRVPEYVRLLDQLPPGVVTVELLGGGEPLLYPDIDPLVREVKRRGFEGFAITNGVALTPRLAATLVEIGWDMIRVSVDAGDADTYRRIHGRDDFDKVVDNLTHLRALRAREGRRSRPKLFVLQVVLPHNVHRVESLFSFAEAVGADYLYFDRVIPFDPAVRLEPAAARRAAADIAILAATSRVPCNAEWILHRLDPVRPPPAKPPRSGTPGGCLAGYDEAVISSTGEVRPCCVLDRVLGNIRTRPFGEIWFGAEYERLRRDLLHGVWEDQCQRCWMDGSLIA